MTSDTERKIQNQTRILFR